MVRPVHGFEDQRMNGMMLRKQNRMIGKTSAETILVQNLYLVLILVRESFLLVIDAKIQRFAVEILLMVRLRRSSRRTHMGLLPVLLLIRGTRQATTVAVAQIVWQFFNVRHANAQRIDAGLLRADVARHFSWTRVFLPHGWRVLRVVQQRWGQGNVTEISAHHTASVTLGFAPARRSE